ncbi:hypothetical protein [Streptomyces sp. 2P-4]|uniref:hypothetical protein n=1 Tax=Streptomyces sp. 2P-4 TaxID=2931974 RepID=UPI00254033FB|nr:hypothetical protein [Streptomyces sp. 2P-4]
MARRALTAAASRYTTRRLRARTTTVDQGWQLRAWDMYDSTPEVRFAANWVANAMSGLTLFAGRRGPDGKVEPVPDTHRAAELVASIAGGPDGQAQMLADFGPHLVVPGEAWIVIRPTVKDEVVTGETWHVLSVKEVSTQGSKMVAEIDGFPVEVPEYDEDDPDPDPAAPVAIRVWEAHPARQIEADSPVRASIGLLEELQLLNAAVAAIARSRLTGRGILLVPKGTKFPGTPAQGDAEDDLIDVLMTVAETAYREPESAAATVPIILEVPAETIGDIKRLTFESDFDELAIKLRDEAIRRFATGLDVPAEILLGMGGINHWGVWALSQEAIRLGVEPRAKTVVHALTTQWLRPILEAEDDPDADDILVWYDSSGLRVRTNRSETALKVFEAGGISAEALRRETGFDEADAPNPGDAPTDEGDGEEDDPLPADETNSEPEQNPDAEPVAAVIPARPGEGILAAADGLIWAALTTAGKRLLNSPACPRSERARWTSTDPARLHTLLPVDAAQVEQRKLLDDAWTRTPELAARYGLDPECLTASLDDYTRSLIAAGIDHEYGLMEKVVAPCVGAAA